MECFKNTVSFGRRIMQAAAAMLFPYRCPLCEKAQPLPPRLYEECTWQQLVCESCRKKLPWIAEPICKKCGRPIENETAEFCSLCERQERPYLEGRGIFSYRKEMRDSVLRMKFHNHREYLDFYAAAMAGGGKGYLARIRPEVIIPVPMSTRKRRERGFDQCRLLARRLSKRTGIPTEEKLLVRSRNTLPQKGLGRRQRRENLKDAFCVAAGGVLPERVLLVDDIMTTGSTVEACCEALQEAGITKIYVLVLCMD